MNAVLPTTGHPCWGFVAQPDENPIIYELHIDLVTGVASTYGFGRAAVAGITPTTPVAVQPHSPANITTGKSTCQLLWATEPTIPAQFFRRKSLPATVGSGVIWTFPGGIAIEASHEVVVWNLATNTTSANITVVCEE